MSTSGIHYRKTQPAGQLQQPHVKIPPAVYPEPPQPLGPTHTVFQEIESAEASLMVDSSSQTLVEELNLKRQRYRLWRFPALLTLGILIAGIELRFPAAYLVGLAILGTLVSIFTYVRDVLQKTTVVLYDADVETQSAIYDLHVGFDQMRSSRAIWHFMAVANVIDRKYHAGATGLVQRKSIALSTSNPPFVKTNVPIPRIPVGRQVLYFFPDRVLIFDQKGIGAVAYEHLAVDVSTERFIEEETVPADSRIIDTTWKYVNKKGGPDRRFRDNRQLPIALYDNIHFWSQSGLNEKIAISATGKAYHFQRAIRHLAKIL